MSAKTSLGTTENGSSPEERFRLADYVRKATTVEPEKNADGSITIYLRLHKRERYSILPRPQRRPWLDRVFGGRSAGQPATDPLAISANVRRVRRGPELI